jgi:hypothetical protein
VPVPPEDKRLDAPIPQLIIATGRVLPELGETTASADQMIQQKIAVQIVSLMEKRW